MKKFCCETHVNHALDMMVAETKEYPILEKVDEEQQLSTKCDYCENEAKYIVSRK
ncbi:MULTISPECIES: CxxH/CxxC protein [Ureibacillus]|jgi:CxxH/CxxC protein (TIGR04129 family)|uniref:CxxH/CxxC protein n=1 Tax=Ureibacillus suwonensis TaxID=313007 RepID=A0ABW0RJB9_9BACL|nr:CxxH/CxxC protein [Ureibacillus thermosphaericus]